MSLFDEYVAWMSGTTAEEMAATGGRVRAKQEKIRADALAKGEPDPTGGRDAWASVEQSLQFNAAGSGLNLVGLSLGTAGNFMAGLQAQRAAEYQAEQLRINAGQAQASSQREAYEADQKSQLVMSRTLAVAAASGGGASDPTVVNIIAKEAERGAYLRAVALYNGDERARSMLMEADSREYQGKVERLTSTIGAGTAIVKGATNILASQQRGASLYQRFAGDGPQIGDNPFGGT